MIFKEINMGTVNSQPTIVFNQWLKNHKTKAPRLE